MVESGSAILAFTPLLLVMWLANLAEREKQAGRTGAGAAATAIALLTVCYVLAVLFGLVLTVDGALGYPGTGPMLSAGLLDGESPFASELLVGLGLLVPSVLGLLLLFVRLPDGLSARLGMSIQRNNVVHAIAVSLTMLAFVNLLITLGVGLNNLATTLVEGAEEASSRGVPPLGLWTQSVLMVALAAVGVGWPVRRTLGDTLARLGLEPISLRQVGIGLGLGIVVAPLMLLAMALVERVGIQPDADVEALNEALLGPLMTSPLGILTIGFAAGIGEETLLRGAVQPRFGLWLTAALFAILHSNYGVSLSTLIVFILGLGLGLVRIRYNTTTSILVHAAYNVTLSVILVFASSYLEV